MNKNLLVLIAVFALCASIVSAQNLGLAGSAKSKANDVLAPSVSMTPQYSVKAILFEDDFSSNIGWTLGSSWAIDAAVAEPATDHSPTGDNGIMACPLGTDYPNDMARTEATSPVINCSAVPAVTLSYWSFSGCENDTWDHMGVEVYNGSSWVEIWANGSSDFQESAWTYREFDVTSQAAGNANFQVRFYMGTTDGSVTYSGWAVDDLRVSSPEPHDLGVTGIAPSLITLGNSATPQVTVQNFGSNAESSYSVNLVIDGAGYDETVNVSTSIGVGASAVIDMPLWSSPSEGTYEATAVVTVADDGEHSNDTLAMEIHVADIQLGYGFNAYGGSVDVGPVSIAIPDGILTSIAPNGDDFWAGADWVNDTWYAVQYSTNMLLTADPETGTPTNIAVMPGPDFTGLAYDITSGIMYASGYNGSNSLLYTVNLATAATELVGTSLADGLIIGIACDASGNLYGIDLVNDNLYSINKATGAATTIGPLGILINYAQDIAFDRDNDILYGTLYSSSGGLYEIDVSTGTATLLNDFGAEVTGFAIPYGNAPTEFTVTFTVTGEGDTPLEGANININGTNLTTSGSGEASIVLENGSYGYIVTMDGYYGANGTVVVNGANVNEDVSLSIVGLEELNNSNIEIYPNPSKGIITINVNKTYTVEVLSTTGELILSRELTDTQNIIDLSPITGMYIIRLVNGDETLTSKIMIE